MAFRTTRQPLQKVPGYDTPQSTTPRAPIIQIVPTLGSKVCKIVPSLGYFGLFAAPGYLHGEKEASYGSRNRPSAEVMSEPRPD